MQAFRLGSRRRDILKCLPGSRQNGAGACYGLEPPQDHIAVGRIIFNQAGAPPRLLCGDHGRAGTAEWIEHNGAASAAILDRVGHEVDRLDRGMQFKIVQTPSPKGVDARNTLFFPK
jgi:hypothetical protein